MSWATRGVVETAEAVRAGKVLALDVVEESLAEIDRLNPELNAFVHVDRADALARAMLVDDAVRRGEDPGSLAGVPFGVKDNLACLGMPTRHGTKVFLDAAPEDRDAVFVQRLRCAGAIPVGKTATPEFAMDSSTHSPGYGVTRNPWNPTRTPGGSSGGSAAAVASGMVPLGTGSDLGGSIRSPASCTGLIGLMPTHGRIPMERPSDFDVLGALTFSVGDTARVLDVASGPHPFDRHSLPAPAGSYERSIQKLDVTGLRVCWSTDLGFAVVQCEVAEIAERAARRLADVARLTWSELAPAPLNPYTTILEVESFEMKWSLMARHIYPRHSADLAPLTKSIIEDMAPNEINWMRARGRREEIATDMGSWFSEIDLLMTPTVSAEPFAADGDLPMTVEGRDAADSGFEPFTMIANMCWQPSISIPAGTTASGLPVGLQVIAARHREDQLLRLARIAELAYPWDRWPGISV